jgi:hypothetical protein
MGRFGIFGTLGQSSSSCGPPKKVLSLTTFHGKQKEVKESVEEIARSGLFPSSVGESSCYNNYGLAVATAYHQVNLLG